MVLKIPCGFTPGGFLFLSYSFLETRRKKMAQKKEQTQGKKDKDLNVSCPRCNQPAILHTPTGFGQATRIICKNPLCPSLTTNAGWGN
ncbi:MAG: hypothetical protein A2Y67_01345 [Candidatus Buchananbacteria bacterium RBG_13_39_9]|uniref:Uncharacterized protein n=1 Tax=Candidatus Buchananbacteria bacterium RBG_13_39_9 TaxID=1797531 RepID=A0A1G1XRS8_9BACT|nr:MAG: hypothetical protein A2Y67_01345 [Candidatus Buchananbacteria bacterium RBG_13_39_9]